MVMSYPSRRGWRLKNWDHFVFSPLFAIETRAHTSFLKFSSAKRASGISFLKFSSKGHALQIWARRWKLRRAYLLCKEQEWKEKHIPFCFEKPRHSKKRYLTSGSGHEWDDKKVETSIKYNQTTKFQKEEGSYIYRRPYIIRNNGISYNLTGWA